MIQHASPFKVPRSPLPRIRNGVFGILLAKNASLVFDFLSVLVLSFGDSALFLPWIRPCIAYSRRPSQLNTLSTHIETNIHRYRPSSLADY